MSKQAINRTLGALVVPLLLAAGCGDADPETQDSVNERIAITSIEVTSGDDLYLLHPVRVTIEAELSGEAFDTDLLVGLRTLDGSEGCVLGAMSVEHLADAAALDPSEEDADPRAVYTNEAEFVIDRACYELVERDDVEFFASFDPWNRLGDREPPAASADEGTSLDLFSIVAASALDMAACESCENTYTLDASPGLDAELQELNLSSVVAVIPVAAEGGEEVVKTTDRPDFSLTLRSRVVGLAKGQGLEDEPVHMSHRIRPLGSSGPGLALLQRQHQDYEELAAIPVPSSGDVVSVALLYIEDEAREALVDGSWADLEEFELVSCLETDFDQAIYNGEDEARGNDCGSLPVVIVRQEVDADGQPTQNQNPGAAKVRDANVWIDSWWANSGYGFGQSGMMFEAWVEANATGGASWTHKGIRVHSPGSWFEAGFDFNAKVFGFNLSLAELYATFIAYDFGGGTLAMGASLFGDDFIPQFQTQIDNGEALTLQDVFDAAGINADPVLSQNLTIAGVNFDDGCGSVDAGLWIEATAGLDTNQTSVTVSTTRQGVEVSGTITPFVSATARAGTQVNYSEWIGGGITANLNLVDIHLPFTVAVERVDYDPLEATRLSFNQYAQTFLSALSGSIYFNIYYTIPWPLCWSDCTDSHDHTIASWNGVNTDMTFFNSTSNTHYGDEAPSSGGWWCRHSNSELHAGDFDGDGATDYLCHDVTNGNKHIDFNDGGAFTGTDWSQSGGMCGANGNFQLLVGDFDGDGRDDLMCHDIYWKAIDYADVNGHFDSAEWTANGTWCTASDEVIRTGDFNGDGRDDLYCHDYSGNKMIDYADVNGQFGGSDWSGTILPNSFCGLYDGQQIALGTAHDMFVQARPSGWGWQVDQASDVGSWERFTVECHGEKVALKTHHGRYLMARNASNGYDISQQSSVGGWEQFIPVAQDGGVWSFLTFHGRYLMARSESSDYAMDQQTHAGGWERFSVIPQ